MKPRAAAIIIDQESVLLVHRIKGDREYWVLPGGSAEAGESDEAGCHREVREETGLTIRILQQVRVLNNEGRREVYFLARPAGGKLALGEPERSCRSPANQYHLEWVDRHAFAKINFQPEDMRKTVSYLFGRVE